MLIEKFLLPMLICDDCNIAIHHNTDLATAHPLCERHCVTVDSPHAWDVQLTHCRWPQLC